MRDARGDYIGGRFLAPSGEELCSRNPAREGETVFVGASSPERIGQACEAAAEAGGSWARRSWDERVEALGRFRDALSERARELAEAITLETGKVRREARAEVESLLTRFASVEAQVRADLEEGPLPGHPSEALWQRPLGVVGVIGPFNFPLHLFHVHVVPALLLGNTVVVKPSEVTPLCAQRYAEAARAAGLPAGVLNVVQGAAAEGAALVADRRIRGLAFTGSYASGRRIAEALLDRPEVLLAL